MKPINLLDGRSEIGKLGFVLGGPAKHLDGNMYYKLKHAIRRAMAEGIGTMPRPKITII